MEIGFSVGQDYICPVSVFRNLGVYRYLSSQLTMKQHIRYVTKTCFFHIRRLKQIRRYLGTETTTKPVLAFIVSRHRLL